jgi:putative heme-binding domain-containing protein
VLLEAIEREQLTAADLDPTAHAVLSRIPNADLQSRARKSLQKYQASNRREVVQKYQEALRLGGDAQRGSAVFTQNCLACHQMQGQGYRVGPDLSGIASRPAAALLEDILDPSKEVSPDFINYTLITKGGQLLSGLLVSETATSIRLRRGEGAEDAVLRREIDELRASGKSLMPEGFEQTITPQDMADLLHFLRKPVPLPAKK